MAQPIVPYNSEDLYTRCWLNHYVTKSWEEWCEKLLVRGQTLLFRKLEDFFIYNPDMISLKEELYNKEYCKDKRLVVGDKLY